jgi:raffinose/stachyose/melibiose transport system substrate-binding protein
VQNRRMSSLFTLTLLTMAIMLSACAPATTQPTVADTGGEQAAAQASSEIAMWLDVTGGADNANCIVAEIVDRFNTEQAGRIVVNAGLQANAWDATRTALAGGSGPDIVQTPGPSWAAQLAMGGQLLSLDEYATEYGWNDRFADWSLSLGEVNDSLYSIPHELETMVLYYNKTLFEEKGWEVPQTMDELRALAATVKEEGIIPFAHANAETRFANGWHLNEMWNQVAGPQKVYEALTSQIQWNEDPGFYEAVDILNTMQQEGYFMGGLDRYYTTTHDERRTAFGDGRAAMILEGTWFMSSIDQYFGEEAGNTNEWEWVPVPSKTGEVNYSLGLGSTFSINANTQHPDESAEFLNYFFSPEVQAHLVNTCGFDPAPVEIEADLLTELDPRVARLYEELSEASAEGRYGYTLWTFWPPKSNAFVREELERVWAGDISVQEYLDNVQELFEEEVEAGDVKPVPARSS